MPSLENWGGGLKIYYGQPTLPTHLCTCIMSTCVYTQAHLVYSRHQTALYFYLGCGCHIIHVYALGCGCHVCSYYCLSTHTQQAALLYTTYKGERRLRIHNIALNCTTKYQDIYRSCEIDTIVNFFSKSRKYNIRIQF